MIKIIYIIQVIIISSCLSNVPRHKTQESLFREFCQEFRSIDKMNMDSVNLAEVIEKNPYSIVDKTKFKFIKSKKVNESCENNQRYSVYNVGKIDQGNDSLIVLLFYLKLNEDCQYDGFENLFLLCKYDRRGNLLTEDIIGKYYLVFGESEFIYFNLLAKNKIELTKIISSNTDNENLSSTRSKTILNW